MLSRLKERLNNVEMMERGISRIQMIQWLPGWVDTIIRDATGATAGARVRMHAGPGSVLGHSNSRNQMEMGA
jgi:hypothetical protein